MPNYINDLKNNLTFALANVALRQEILADVGKYAADAISDEELLQIYTFIVFIISKPGVKHQLERMSQELGKIIARSTKNIDYPNSPPLPRSLVLRNSGDMIRVGFIENSKTAIEKNPNLKLKRSIATVSRILDVTPGMVTRVVPLTTKSYTIGNLLPIPARTTPRIRGKGLTREEHAAIESRRRQTIAAANANAAVKAPAWQTALRNVRTAQKTGLNAQVFDTYTKKNGMQAVRTIEPWSSTNLFTIHPLMASWSPVFAEGFVYDTVLKLLTQLDRMHNELQIVHGDINPETVGFMLTGEGTPKINFKDFENSASLADLGSKSPVSRAPFCSPKVVKFNMYAQESVRSEMLYEQFSVPYQHGKYYPSFARESLETMHLLHGIDDPAALYPQYYANELRYGTDDDMYSLGMTLFVLITGCYPTISGLQGQAYLGLNYSRVQDAYRMYPQYARLLQGLLFMDESKRLNATQALAVFDQIPDPRVSVESVETVDEPVMKVTEDRESGSTSTSTYTSAGETASPLTLTTASLSISTPTPTSVMASSISPLTDRPSEFRPSNASAFRRLRA